eukprot:10117979-Prorocentrum_lima.AAC.1
MAHYVDLLASAGCSGRQRKVSIRKQQTVADRHNVQGVVHAIMSRALACCELQVLHRCSGGND